MNDGLVVGGAAAAAASLEQGTSIRTHQVSEGAAWAIQAKR